MQFLKRTAQFVLQKIGNDNAAYLCWFLASVLWALGFIYPNQHKVDFITSNLSRGLSLLLFNGTLLYGRQLLNASPPIHQELGGKDLLNVTARHMLLSVYGFGFSESQFYLPAPVLYTIYFAGPLFIISIDYSLFKIPISKRQAVGVGLTGLGVLLTANGQYLQSYFSGQQEFHTTFKNYKTNDLLTQALVAIIMIILTFGWASAQILVREVKNKNHLTINFNFGIILTVFSALLAISSPNTIVANDGALFFKCILLQGLPIALAQAFFMSALLLSKKSGPITMIGFVGVVISYGISVFRYHEPLSLICVLGAGLALIGIFRTVM